MKMFPDVTRLYLLDKYHNPDKVFDSSNVSAYILDRFIGFEETENVFLLLLDKKGKEVYSGMIGKGDFNSANVSVREIVTLALNYGAVYAILAHSHPSGFAMPSKDDILVTKDIKAALKLVKVDLLDHFIVADHDCVSLAESELM